MASRIAAPGRVRNGVYKGLLLDGKYVCLDCRGDLPPIGRYGTLQQPLRCDPCKKARFEMRRPVVLAAMRAIRRAVEAGDIPHARTLRCVDCGKPAFCYDHRDYTKPLRVEPVCRSCNVMRGPADVWPTASPALAAEGQG